jgi:hypothetical protein
MNVSRRNSLGGLVASGALAADAGCVCRCARACRVDEATFLWNCANDAVGPDKDVFNYGKGTVDFSFDVTFKKADGTDIEKQRVRFGEKAKLPAGSEQAMWRPSMTLPSPRPRSSTMSSTRISDIGLSVIREKK